MQGKGIRLVQTEDQLERALGCVELADAVASHYIDKPLLLDGLKFDLRIYALVTSCEPLRVFLFKQGLVRCCTQAYQQPEVSHEATSAEQSSLAVWLLILHFTCMSVPFMLCRAILLTHHPGRCQQFSL